MKALRLFIWMVLLTGIIYPLLIFGIGQLLMSKNSQGSLIFAKDRVVGSRLIGQKFQDERYFWGRPSAGDYNPLPSTASNLAPTSEQLKKKVAERKAALLKDKEDGKVPSELLFASGSGLDPHISPSTAYYQLPRVAKARHAKEDIIRNLVETMTKQPFLGFIGEPTVNVLELNLALDRLFKADTVQNEQ